MQPNTAGIYCPGCQPGDFAQPHICVAGQSALTLASGFCGLCNVYWTGSHACFKTWPNAAPTVQPTTTLTTSVPAPEPPCEHCFCLKQKQGWYDVPSRTHFLGRENLHLKAHDLCCNCGFRRLKVKVAVEE